MTELINYNFMTRPASHCVDSSEEFYNSCGVSRGNKNGFSIETLKDGDVIFVKTDFIHNGTFQKQILPQIKTKFILVTGVSSFSVDEGDSSYLDILNHQWKIEFLLFYNILIWGVWSMTILLI